MMTSIEKTNRIRQLLLLLLVICASLAVTMTSATTEPGTTACDDSSQKKTIYLIRHAESLENSRMASFKNVAYSLTRFCLPSSKDVSHAFPLWNMPAHVDSHVSDFGRQQIEHMAAVLEQSDFVRHHKIQLVAHSPLLRARDTCEGMLKCLAPDMKTDLVEHVVELDLLKERTPLEWMPGNYGSLVKRLRALEDWIVAQPQTIIALVGHSQFFKALLELDYKFGNCDVMEVQFDGAAESQKKKWTDLKEIHLCRLESEEGGEAATEKTDSE